MYKIYIQFKTKSIEAVADTYHDACQLVYKNILDQYVKALTHSIHPQQLILELNRLTSDLKTEPYTSKMTSKYTKTFLIDGILGFITITKSR